MESPLGAIANAINTAANVVDNLPTCPSSESYQEPCNLLNNNDNVVKITSKDILEQIEDIYVHDMCTPDTQNECVIDMGTTTYNTIGYKGKKATGEIIDNMSLDNYNPRQCSELCTNTAECNSWQFKDNVCTLKKGLTLSITDDNNYVADIKTICGKVGYIATGQPILNPVSTVDECACKKMCNNISQCFSWQYENGMCSFKDAGFISLTQNDNIIAGLKHNECGKFLKSESDEPYKTIENISSCECQEHCVHNEECSSWSYHKNDITAGGICKLFNSNSVEFSETNTNIVGNTRDKSTKCSPIIDTSVNTRISTKINALTSCECNNYCNQFDKCNTWDFYYDHNKKKFTCVLKELVPPS